MPKDTDINSVYSLLDFVRRAESLKSTLRTTWTQSGRQESTAEHSWRLSLFAMLVSEKYPELDTLKVLKLCIIHDLGEAINGDIPAPEQKGVKTEQEEADLIDLLRPLQPKMQYEILELWKEYEGACTPEARIVKALDKLETILQQAQGTPPSSFDYSFNLSYGTRYTAVDEFINEIRAAADAETESCMLAQKRRNDEL